MIKYYLTTDGVTEKVDSLVNGAWVNVYAPTNAEIEEIQTTFDLPEEFLRSSLDEEETSHIVTEEDKTLIVLDIPCSDKNGDEVTYQAEINAYIGGDSFSGEMLPEDNWEMPVDGDWMENEPEEPKKSVFGNPLLLGGIGAGVLVLGIVLGVVIGKRKKKDADEYED